MLLVEEEGRKLIRANNEKSVRGTTRPGASARRSAQRPRELVAETQGDDAAGSAGKKKKVLFNREAAMQLLQPDFYLSMMDGYGTHIDEITDTCLLLEPSLAVARTCCGTFWRSKGSARFSTKLARQLHDISEQKQPYDDT